MTCSVVLRTWWKDVAWARWCLATVDRFASGFDEVVVVLPHSSKPWLRGLGSLGPRVRVEFCADFDDDYLGQQVTKLHADMFTDADFICHLDADCMFVKPVTPEVLMPTGRPVVVTKDVALLDRHWPWGESSAEFLGWPVRFDCMQRPPFVFPRWLYAEVRNHCGRLRGVPIEEYVLGRPPRGFSEFTVLGNFAHRYHAEAFEWMDADDARSPEWCRWYWSWEGLTPDTEVELRRLVVTGEPR